MLIDYFFVELLTGRARLAEKKVLRLILCHRNPKMPFSGLAYFDANVVLENEITHPPPIH